MPFKTSISSRNGNIIEAFHKIPTGLPADKQHRMIVIMVHGYPGNVTSHNDLFGDTQSELHERGFHTLRFNFQGCGQGDEQNSQPFTFHRAVQDLKDVLQWVKGRKYNKVIFVSEGFGTMVALMSEEVKITAHAMLWPALNPNALGIMPNHIETLGPALSKELETLKFGSYLRDISAPTLILQGMQDEFYPAQQLDLVRKYASPKRLEISKFHGGETGLKKMEHRKMLLQSIGDFLEAQL